MTKLIIEGGRPLRGSFTASGNKNAALPMLAASLLTSEPVTLHNVPAIRDVQVMMNLLEAYGVAIERAGSSVTLTAASLSSRIPDPELFSKVRASILVAGPLAARTGKAELHPPGGDVIGRRRIDTHIEGLARLGYRFSRDTKIRFSRKGPARGTSMLLDEASVTATENILMAATLAEGETVIYNAACEPHVQNLGELLIAMGAEISGLGTNRITVRGVRELHGAELAIGPDYVEVGSYMAAAFATGGRVRFKDLARRPELDVIGKACTKLGATWKKTGQDLVVDGTRPREIVDDVGQAIPKLDDGIWPSFPSDLMSVAIVLATQCRGSMLFHEKLFESRMVFVDRLIEMGARIVQCDPHRVLVQGPCQLQGIAMSSPDIRAGIALLIAALCAEGTSVIHSAEVIDRGYERIDQQLAMLGAAIHREG
ncbi:MAG: UDP-N-acetylglucosamine 1-carboxyvinyltransferase [Verrucomicrobia bacterium]|nr:UDP-N-acetylglucosamine 1-carboxyvinyltransferase [Verrucomicrobiota bacterium]